MKGISWATMCHSPADLLHWAKHTALSCLWVLGKGALGSAHFPHLARPSTWTWLSTEKGAFLDPARPALPWLVSRVHFQVQIFCMSSTWKTGHLFSASSLWNCVRHPKTSNSLHFPRVPYNCEKSALAPGLTLLGTWQVWNDSWHKVKD